jgi:nucleoside-diphosphate-sugar epimerase
MHSDIKLVLGASGFIGTRLVANLAHNASPSTVRAVDILPPRKTLAGVEYHTLDVRRPLPQSLGQGVTTLYNLAAVHRTPGHPDHEYYDTNLAGALHATTLAVETDIRQIVFTSSISVYGPSDELKSEESPLEPVSAYGKSKRFAEEIHRRWAFTTAGSKLVIARPGVVFGPGELGNYTNLARALRLGIFAYPGRRTAIKSGGHVDDLLGALDFALRQPDPYVLLNFAYPDASSTEDIVAAFGAITGKLRRPLTVPMAPMLAAAFAFECANAVGLRNPIHRERIHKLVNSTRIQPGWLIKREYPFKMTLPSALQSWSAETNGTFQ